MAQRHQVGAHSQRSCRPRLGRAGRERKAARGAERVPRQRVQEPFLQSRLQQVLRELQSNPRSRCRAPGAFRERKYLALRCAGAEIRRGIRLRLGAHRRADVSGEPVRSHGAVLGRCARPHADSTHHGRAVRRRGSARRRHEHRDRRALSRLAARTLRAGVERTG